MSKHTAGICDVGKFMHLWKQHSSATCPRCREFEDATHVWQCKGANAEEVWKRAISALENWMESVQTDPEVQAVIVAQLNSWRSGSEDTYTVPFHLQPAIQQQNDMGWNNFWKDGCHLIGSLSNRLITHKIKMLGIKMA